MTQEQLTLVVVQFVLCTGIGWACMCRINLMTSNTLRFYRAAYSLMLATATAVGFAPILLHELPTRASVLMAAGVLVVVCAGLRNWRGGAPPYTAKEKAPMSANLYPVCLVWDAGRGRARHDGVDRTLRRAPKLAGGLGVVDRIEFIPSLNVCRLAERACDPWRDMTRDEIEDTHLWLVGMSTAAHSFEG